MDPYLWAAHAFGNSGREWVERAEFKKLMERPVLFTSRKQTEMATWLYLTERKAHI